MTDDRVHPSANKPSPAPAKRLPYRPQPPPRTRSHRGRGGCSLCSCCLCLMLLVLLVTVAAGAVLYAFYRPHLPSFSINTLHLSTFNLTATSVTTAFNFSITARNPNKRIDFFYDQISVRFISGDVAIGEGSFSGFAHGKRNVTTLRTVISSSNSPIPDGAELMKSGSLLPMKIELETKVKAKAWGIKTNKIRIRVTCRRIEISIPAAGKAATLATTSDVKCKIDPRVKIIKWTV